MVGDRSFGWREDPGPLEVPACTAESVGLDLPECGPTLVPKPPAVTVPLAS